VKIVDFGVARLVYSCHIRDSQLIGSFQYLSPEQPSDFVLAIAVEFWCLHVP
jgi:serine/threonine protein kinase